MQRASSAATCSGTRQSTPKPTNRLQRATSALTASPSRRRPASAASAHASASDASGRAAINAASTYLPRDLPNPPVYSKVNPADTPILTLALTSDTLPLTKVQDLADTNLAQKIAQLSGVGLVSISGSSLPAVRVELNPRTLFRYGIGLEDVRAALKEIVRHKNLIGLDVAQFNPDKNGNGDCARKIVDLLVEALSARLETPAGSNAEPGGLEESSTGNDAEESSAGTTA